MHAVPDKFHPPKSFPFPKHSETCNETKQSFHGQTSGVRNTAAWLHYDDAAFCYVVVVHEISFSDV